MPTPDIDDFDFGSILKQAVAATNKKKTAYDEITDDKLSVWQARMKHKWAGPEDIGCSDENAISNLFRIGVEYEIESILGWDDSVLEERHIKVTNDGSLRNEGKEFITQPETKIVSYLTFKRLFGSLKFKKDTSPFSHRTSIHIHMNVASMKVPNFFTLVYTYAALEPFFFKFVGEERMNNIHCVPLYNTHLSKYYKNQNISDLMKTWSKYSAFNLLPVWRQGSIEFRHMYGTADFELFQTWVNMIEDLYVFAVNTEVKKLKEFWLNGGTVKQLEALVFKSSSKEQLSLLTEEDYFISKMEAKSAFL